MWEWQSLLQRIHICVSVVSGRVELQPSFLCACLSAAALISVSSPVVLQHSPTLRYQLQGPPRTWCRCRQPSYLLRRHLYVVGEGGRVFSSPMPAHRRGCISQCGHPPYDGHDPNTVFCVVYAECTCKFFLYWEVQHETGHQSWLLCHARISPGYTANASHVECVEPSHLPGTCGPCIAAIHHCAGNTGIVARHHFLHRHIGACPQSSCQKSESCSCLPNPLVDLCIRGEVVSDGGAEVGELVDSMEFVVVDGNDRQQCFCAVLLLCPVPRHSSDWWSVRSPYTSLWEAVHQWLEFIPGVGRNGITLIEKLL